MFALKSYTRSHKIVLAAVGCIVWTLFSFANGQSTPAIKITTLRIPIEDRTDIRFHHLSLRDGLSQTRVGQIVQDDQGFMWFGTQYGLNRFDGYEYKVFIHDPQDPNSLGGVYVHTLFKDRKGILWIGCNNLFDKFDPAKERSHIFAFPRSNRETNSQRFARSVRTPTVRSGYRLQAAFTVWMRQRRPSDPSGTTR